MPPTTAQRAAVLPLDPLAFSVIASPRNFDLIGICRLALVDSAIWTMPIGLIALGLKPECVAGDTRSARFNLLITHKQ